MINVKQNFRYICIILIVAQIIILVTVMIIYISNTNDIISSINKHKKSISIIYRDTNKEYLTKKMHLLLEDGLLILKTYENIINWKLNTYNDYGSIATREETDSSYSGPWYLELDKIEQYLFGGVYLDFKNASEETNIKNKNYLTILAKTEAILKKLFMKYFGWKNKIYIPINYLYFAFSTGLFYKYPRLYSSYFDRTDYDNTVCSGAESGGRYDPRCRPFYTQSQNSNDKITITEPYRFATGEYGNDICFKKKDGSNTPIVFCMAFNFNDYYIFQNTIKKTMNLLETTHYIGYYDKSGSKNLKIVYNTKYMPQEVKCVDNLINDKEYNCEPVNFFDIYFKKELDELNKKLSEKYPNSEKDVNKKYIDNYNTLQITFKENIYNQFISIISNNKLKEIEDINLSNLDDINDSLFSFKSYINVTVDSNELKFNIEKTDNEELFFVYPLLSGYTYDDNYSLSTTDNYYYFLIIQAKGNGNSETKKSFKIVICCEFLFFLFYLLIFDLLIWFFFGVLHYYILKGFLLPLKKIKIMYLSLAKISSVADPLRKENIKSYGSLKKIALEGKNDIISKLKNMKQSFIERISNFFQIEKHEEISNALLTLKAINLIISFQSNYLPYEDINEDHDFSQMCTFYEALLFLSECFYSKKINKNVIDFHLVKLVVETIIKSMINQLIKEDCEMSNFYSKKKQMNNSNNDDKKKGEEDIVKIREKKIDLFFTRTKQSLKRAKNEIFNVSKNEVIDEKINEQVKEDLLIIAAFEENLNYLYATFKGQLFEYSLNKFYFEQSKQFLNIEEEEKKILSQIKRKEQIQERKRSLFCEDKVEGNNVIQKLIKEKKSQIKEITINDELSDNTKKCSFTLIENFVNYLDIKRRNKEEFLTKHKTRTLNTVNRSLSNSLKLEVSDNRIREMQDLLQEISILFYLSRFYIICDEEQKGIVEYENALNLLKKFEKKINLYKGNNANQWKTTNFVLLTINTIFFEKFLTIFGLLCKKFGLSKNEFFIHINLLDLSPIYSKTIRQLTLLKLLNLLSKEHKKLLSVGNDNFTMYKEIISDNYYIDLQRSIFKLESIKNATIENNELHKNILFVFDLDNKYIKDSVFKNILMHYFSHFNEKHNKKSKENIFSFFFCAFDSKLYMENIPNYEDTKSVDVNYNKKYIQKIEKKKRANSSLSNGNGDKGKILDQDSHNKLEDEKVDQFFNFLNEYKKKIVAPFIKKDKDKYAHRADKAIYHAALFGITEENNIYKKIQRNHLNFSVKEANYLILMTTITSKFTDNKMNWKVMADLFYEKKYTVIIILSYDPEMENENNVEVKEKLNNYMNFIKYYVIDGQLFVMRSLTLFKFILNSIFPVTFNEFDQEIIKQYFYSLDNIEK